MQDFFHDSSIFGSVLSDRFQVHDLIFAVSAI